MHDTWYFRVEQIVMYWIVDAKYVSMKWYTVHNVMRGYLTNIL